MRTRSHPEEPTVQVVDFTQDGETTVTGTEPPPRPWLILAGIATLAVGLGYGFLLGRGDRPPVTTEPAPSGTRTTAVTTVTVEPRATQGVSFRASVPGHDLGGGVIEYLNPNLFSTLAIDDAGRVWAGGPAGVVRLDPDTGEFDRLTGTDGTGPVGVRDLAAGPDGSVYAATAAGLSLWDGFEWGQDSVLTEAMSGWAPELETRRDVGPVAVSPDGTVWLATRDWSWPATSQVHHGRAPFSGVVPTTELEGHVQELAVGPDGGMWVIADEALWHYDGAWAKTLLGGWMSTMEIDASGVVWVAREDEIVRLDGADDAEPQFISWAEALGVERMPEGDIGGMVVQIAVDAGGPVWALAEVWEPGPDWPAEFGEHRLTLIRIDDGDIATVALPEMPPDSWIADMAVAPGGDLWLARRGALMRFDGADWSDYFIPDQPPIGYPWSMAVEADGDLWIAGYEGVSALTAEGWQAFRREQFRALGAEGGDAWVASGGERVWVGIGCRVFEHAGGAWEPLPPLPDQSVECRGIGTATPSEGNLRLAAMGPFGGNSSVYELTDGEWQDLGRAAFPVNAMDVGPDGTTWLAGWDGLGRLEDGFWKPLVTGQGFDQVVLASDGTAWVMTEDWPGSEVWRFRHGTVEIDQHDTYGTVTVALARHPDGSVVALEHDLGGSFRVSGRQVVGGGELRSMVVGPDGTIWVGGEGRLYRLLPPGEVDLTVVDWKIELDEAGPGVHTVHLNVGVHGVRSPQITGTSGRLIWDDAVVELCNVGVDNYNGFLGVGDIFQTTEGCGADPTAMQDAFDAFGLPATACVFVDVLDRRDALSHCAPLVPVGDPP